MNTRDEWKTTATLCDPERQAFWREVFGGDVVPIKSFVPELVHLPGFTEPQVVYMLALNVITDEQRERLVQGIARNFGVPVEYVADHLDEQGVPILASGVVISSSDRAMVLGAIL